MLRRKRRSDDLSESTEESHLTEQIKKVRITSTPGDLRLQNDLLDFQKIQSIILQESHEKSCIILTFNDLPDNCPNTYHIRVPKLYPHDPPIVTCLNPDYVCQYIDSDGRVHHPALSSSWTAINCLVDVAQILQEISSSIYQMSLNMECQRPSPSLNPNSFGSYSR